MLKNKEINILSSLPSHHLSPSKYSPALSMHFCHRFFNREKHCWKSAGLNDRNSFKVKPSTENITMVFWDDYAKMSAEKGPSFGERIPGFCITIMHLPKHPSKFANFVQRMPWVSSLIPSIHLTWLRVIFSSRLKSTLKGRRFQTIPEIQENTLKELRSFKPEDFQQCFSQLKKRWQKCIDKAGEYFEGDRWWLGKLLKMLISLFLSIWIRLQRSF